MRFYEAFDLTPALSLDAEDLKKRFYERSRQWHPDRFSRASAAEQEKALEMTAVLNDAFRTLRDPISRAEYFLKEKGMELSKGDESARPQLIEARGRFIAMRDSIDEALTAAGARGDLEEVRALLNRRRYIRNLIRDVENVLPN
jgi:molecular chaperone HscB